jgi:hypothetical protein
MFHYTPNSAKVGPWLLEIAHPHSSKIVVKKVLSTTVVGLPGQMVI